MASMTRSPTSRPPDPQQSVNHGRLPAAYPRHGNPDALEPPFGADIQPTQFKISGVQIRALCEPRQHSSTVIWIRRRRPLPGGQALNWRVGVPLAGEADHVAAVAVQSLAAGQVPGPAHGLATRAADPEPRGPVQAVDAQLDGVCAWCASAGRARLWCAVFATAVAARSPHKPLQRCAPVTR
jgi:hypothetical protein